MCRALLHTIGIVGGLLAWSSDVLAQPAGYYAPYPLAQRYPPSYYQPPPSYYAAPSYAQLPNYVLPPAPMVTGASPLPTLKSKILRRLTEAQS
jgi:hypothetical protein